MPPAFSDELYRELTALLMMWMMEEETDDGSSQAGQAGQGQDKLPEVG